VRRVVDLDPARLAAVRARFPEIETSREAAPALADPEVDAVVVATPTATHHALAKAALEAGKHVLVEKPLAACSRDADELCALAEARRRVLMVGHVFLYNAAVRWVKDALDAGRLGRVRYLSAVRANPGPARADVNAAFDLATHDIAVASFWLGAEPLAASATGASWSASGIEDAVFATLRYPGGVLLNVHASWLSPRKSREIAVVGEAGMIAFDDMDLAEPLRVYEPPEPAARAPGAWVDSFAEFRSTAGGGAITIPRVDAREPLAAECEHFLDRVADGAPPLSSGPSGAAVVRALEAIAGSLRAGGREEAVASAPVEACATSRS
jgi:predicted dehydrogenase